jgi:hypothetical protein
VLEADDGDELGADVVKVDPDNTEVLLLFGLAREFNLAGTLYGVISGRARR